MAPTAPIDLLADDSERVRHRLLIIGCGNVLRGDDAAGPVLVRRLWDRSVLGDDVVLADGGTSGMDVAFKMRDADRVIVVDAAQTGAEPGTIFRVPASQIVEVPPVSGFGSHDFRWDHAIAIGRWLLGSRMPEDITVYLVEGGSYELGEPLSEAVDRALERVADQIVAEAVSG